MFNEAVKLFNEGKIKDSKIIIESELKKNPKDNNNHYLLGLIYLKLNDTDNALNSLSYAQLLDNSIRNSFAYAEALTKKRLFHKSVNCYENILLKDKYHEPTLVNLSYIYFLLEDYKKTESLLLKVISRNNINHVAYKNLGDLYRRINNFKKAMTNYEAAKKLDKNNQEIDKGISLILLKQKKYNEAWYYYESRIYSRQNKGALFLKIKNNILKDNQLNQKKMAVVSEQGLGENILFSSIYNDLIKINPSTIFISDPRLKLIFTRSFKDFEFIDNSDSSKIDQLITENYKFIYAGSLGQYFRRSITDFSGKSFLKVDSQKVKKYKSFLTKQGFKKYVGISWKSSAKNRGEKSVQLKNLLSLFDLKDIGFVNLQYGDNNNDLKDINLLEKIINISDLDLYNEIDDVIALIKCLDLVVTTPNVNVHFAGAIGKSCMVLSPLYNEVFMYSDLNDGKCEWYKNQKTMVIENNLEKKIEIIIQELNLNKF